jgi:hypothetical protein
MSDSSIGIEGTSKRSGVLARRERKALDTSLAFLCPPIFGQGMLTVSFVMVTLSILAGTPFPLPTVNGKPVARVEGQRKFRVPIRFEAARAFYQSNLKTAKQRLVLLAGRRKLELTCTEPSPQWTRAVISEGDIDTVIEVTPVIQLDVLPVGAQGRPSVDLILPRSPEVEKSLKETDPLERLR